MRSISDFKFRAYDKHSNIMSYFNFPGYWNDKEWKSDADFNNCELMQYIGLTDENGKEIYEGDIVKAGADILGVVKYIKGGFIIDPENNLGYIMIARNLHRTIDTYPVKVVGNIYENPEMVKKMKEDAYSFIDGEKDDK